MNEVISALLVHERLGPLRTLNAILDAQGVETCQAETCGEALLKVWSNRPPHLVFTAPQLPDGTWADVIALAEKAALPVNVIVVSLHEDVRFYLDTIERGAFDFITPPFDAAVVAHVVRCAAANALLRRNTTEGLRSGSWGIARRPAPIRRPLPSTPHQAEEVPPP